MFITAETLFPLRKHLGLCLDYLLPSNVFKVHKRFENRSLVSVCVFSVSAMLKQL